HRMMVLDKEKLVVRLVPPRHAYTMHKKASERGEELKVGIAIGIDPLILFAACTRVPLGEEFRYASALKKEPVDLFELENGIPVPHAEIVLEGYIDPEEKAKEGPFVDITGTYDIVRDEPVIKLTRIYQRKNPIYHDILPAGSEHRLLMGIPYEPKIYRSVSNVSDVKNVILTEGGCCYLHAFIQIKKRVEGEGKNAIIAAFSAHQSLKHVVVVDEDIDIFDPDEREYAIATRVRGDRDIIIIPNIRGSSLDPCSEDGLTTKVGIDATKVLGEEERFKRVRQDQFKGKYL
ncbi:MAG: UbiD family decarboxylase, partial [Candidatus Syntropharchaeia archaeon]